MDKINKLFLIVSGIVLPAICRAEGGGAAMGNLKSLGDRSGYTTSEAINIFVIAGYVINVFFSILGIVFIVLLMMAGWNYTTAQGNDAKTKDAIATIRRAVIGLIILIGSYAIYAFVWGRLTSA